MKKINKKEENNNWLAIGMCMGLCLGAGIGTATDNIATWLPIGLCLGVGIGIAFSGDKEDKDKK